MKAKLYSNLILSLVFSIIYICNAYATDDTALLSLAVPSASAMTTDITGQYVYVGIDRRRNFDSINLYNKNNDGSLKFMSSVQSSDLLRDIGSMITSNSGKYIYAAGRNLIDVYKVNSDHSLSQISNSHFDKMQANALGIHMIMTSDDKYLYVTLPLRGKIITFSVNSDGSLTSQGSVDEGSTSPQEMAITDDNKYLYVSNPMVGEIDEFSIGGNGNLASLRIPSITSEYTNVEGVTVANNGHTLYANACQSMPPQNVSCAISAYTISPADGTLSLLNNYVEPGVTQSESDFDNLLAIIPGDRTLYASTVNDSNSSHSTLLAFAVNSDGSLVLVNKNDEDKTYSKMLIDLSMQSYFLNRYTNSSIDYTNRYQ